MDKYEIISENNEEYDGTFYYGVLSTGIFCKPSCMSKTPLKKNVVFFDTKEEAMNEGFRPCKRCRSDLDVYEPDKDIALKVRRLLDEDFKSEALSSKLNSIGLSAHRISSIFKNEFGMTPNEYQNILRKEETVRLLVETDLKILEVSYRVGFNSLSSFYRFFSESEELSPMEYRKKHQKKNFDSKETALGIIRVDYKDDYVTNIQFSSSTGGEGNSLTDVVFNELEEYFEGVRKGFSFKYQLEGTDFQKTVWDALMKVGYGETTTYGELAKAIDRPTASRAVGMALGKNPIMIVVPCHRIIGKSGAITGYAGGVENKKKLLEIEKSI